MANPLDLLGRALLRIGGMTPQQIRQQARANRPQKPMPRANTTRPAPAPTPAPVTRRSRVNGRVQPGADTRGNRPAPPNGTRAVLNGQPVIRQGGRWVPAPPAPGSIQPQGQTNLFSRNGQPRDFRNPNVSANRPPTLSPVPNRGPQATPPQRPVGGFGAQPSPGQGFFNLGAGERQGIPAPDWGRPTTPNSAVVRASGQARTAPYVPPSARSVANTVTRGGPNLGAAFGNALSIGATAGAIIDQAGRVFNPNDNLLTSLNDLRITATNGGRTAPGHTQHPRPQPGNAQSRFAGARDANLNRINSDPRFAAPQPAAPRSPSSAPVHASPAQLRAPAEAALAPAPVQPAQPSVYAPQAGQAPRPNAPVASANPQGLATEPPKEFQWYQERGQGQTQPAPSGSPQPSPANFRTDVDTGFTAQAGATTLPKEGQGNRAFDDGPGYTEAERREAFFSSNSPRQWSERKKELEKRRRRLTIELD